MYSKYTARQLQTHGLHRLCMQIYGDAYMMAIMSSGGWQARRCPGVLAHACLRNERLHLRPAAAVHVPARTHQQRGSYDAPVHGAMPLLVAAHAPEWRSAISPHQHQVHLEAPQCAVAARPSGHRAKTLLRAMHAHQAGLAAPEAFEGMAGHRVWLVRNHHRHALLTLRGSRGHGAALRSMHAWESEVKRSAI